MVLAIVRYFETELWIENTTGFKISFFRESFSSGFTDVGVGAFLQVSRTKADALIEGGDFRSLKVDPRKSIFGGLYSVRGIPADPFPPKEELKILKGASKWQSWGIYAHQPTGRFWIVVLYPDMAGDPPPGALGERSTRHGGQ